MNSRYFFLPVGCDSRSGGGSENLTNISIVTAGSRGDVQPHVALGKGVKAAGHTITVCTSSSFESLITEQGLHYGYMNDAFIKLVDSEAGREAMGSGSNSLGLVRCMVSLMREAKALNREMMKDAWNAGQAAEPDLVVYHPKALRGRICEEDGIGRAITIIESIA